MQSVIRILKSLPSWTIASVICLQGSCSEHGDPAAPNRTAQNKPVETSPAASAQASSLPLMPPIEHPNLPVAARLVQSGQFVDSEIVLRTILRERPDCARAEFLLGVAVMKLKRYGEARTLLESSLSRRQDFAQRKQVDHFLGWTCYYLGDLDGAKSHFQAHVGAVPEAADSYYGLGVIALDEDRLADAQAALDRSIALLPEGAAGARDRSKALARLGDIAQRRDDLPQAIDLFAQATALWPDHYEVWGKLARALDASGKPDEANAAREAHDAALARVNGQRESQGAQQ